MALFGCLISSLYAAILFNVSSHMDPPAYAKCCTISACAALLYPLENGDGGCFGVGLVCTAGCACRLVGAVLGVGML